MPCGPRIRLVCVAGVIATAAVALACTEPPQGDAPRPREYPGLHNVVAYHDGYYSGSAPSGPDGFESLSSLGVRTIISVDGAVPDVSSVAARGMRYIHLPVGYDGFDEKRMLQLARATRDAMARGAVYVHCHHGRHRSAAVAGTIAVSLGWATPDAMLERMRVSGTSPHYDGLYARTAGATPIPKAALDAVPADFPSVSHPAGLVEAMVRLEAVTERLKSIEQAGWRVPPAHPDLVPAAEAGHLTDLLRLLETDPLVRARPAAFTQMLRAGRDSARQLETMLASGGAAPSRLSGRFAAVTASCRRCHAEYRD